MTPFLKQRDAIYILGGHMINVLIFMTAWVVGIAAIIVARKKFGWGLGYAAYVLFILILLSVYVIPRIV